MSHRKVHSQSTVPFLWEEIPGVPKSNFVAHHSFSQHEMKNIPPPPCPVQQGMHKRSSSFRGHAKQDHDPFVAALKECTKRGRTGHTAGGRKNIGGSTSTDGGLKEKKSKFIFPCMRLSDVCVDSMVRSAVLPPLPRGRSSYGRFVMETGE
ncbi:hypothetical protein Vadar_030647 [Vaccinium darrowii]|uniref:Uncharacterized protein n=1 Tax=Vaccinium darrowii TaxID=229202 RepID=A0ACB7YJA2_9ERIC|nr:hypothetical protein Vadar_030647 [Vaccinium darrowii]